MSRFALGRSEESRLDSLANDASLAGLDENDPKSMARWMRKMGKELGEEAGEDFDEMVDELEAGDEPDDGSDDAGSAIVRTCPAGTLAARAKMLFGAGF